jgi:hypoxanthine phosphoribosyltransferase
MAAPLHGEMNSNLKLLIDKEQIKTRVAEVGRDIQRDYQNKDLVIVMVLKGAICIVSDLIREIDLPLNLEAVQCSSYGQKGKKRGELTIHGIDRLNVHNRDVLVVDDIFDSGNTMKTLCQKIAGQKPRSIKSLAFLSKNVKHVPDFKPDYVLFDIEDEFVVGYGLDYKELYRGLPSIYIVESQGI